MDKLSLDALVYPTIRRRAARIGDPQRGSNCQLSATTGLPALSVPAGFTDAGLPTGLELLGRPLEDARLLALGFAFEQSTQPRRAPERTPPLEDGRAPEPVTFVVAAQGTVRPLTFSFRGMSARVPCRMRRPFPEYRPKKSMGWACTGRKATKRAELYTGCRAPSAKKRPVRLP